MLWFVFCILEQLHCHEKTCGGNRLDNSAALRPYCTMALSGTCEEFARDGASVWRDYLSSDIVARLRAEYERIETEREAQVMAGLAEPHVEPMRQHRTIYLADMQLRGEPAAPLLAAPLRDLASSYLKKQSEIGFSSFVRRIGPDRAEYYLPFHQDQTLLRRPLINLWIALDHAGEDAPGLELALGVAEQLQTGNLTENPSGAFPPIPEADVVRRARSIMYPVFEPGDAVVFAGTTPHRTFARPDMTKSRLSVELRLI